MKKIILTIFLVIVLTGICQADPDYYMVVIHNEPNDQVAYYDDLQSIIARADSYGIKLTLMFTDTWADYIVNDSGRATELAAWKTTGHEIAGHHHGVYHSSWDGYTDLPSAEAIAIRAALGKSEPYKGCLCQWFREVSKLNRKMNSGCLNEEDDKTELASPIIYSTCSGYINNGAVGQKVEDTNVNKAQNDYISVGSANGLNRKWLCHFQVRDNGTSLPAAEAKYAAMSSGVLGTVSHSSPAGGVAILLEWLDWLHTQDATGAKSRTMSQIIDDKLLPEESLP